MLSNLVRSVRGALAQVTGGRVTQLAGQDKHGNKYFLVAVVDEIKGTVEKRWVEYKSHPDPTQLPVEWRSWLSHSRTSPPTEEESRSIELYRQEVKRKAKLLAEEEKRRQFREDSLKEQFYSPSDSRRP